MTKLRAIKSKLLMLLLEKKTKQSFNTVYFSEKHYSNDYHYLFELNQKTRKAKARKTC